MLAEGGKGRDHRRGKGQVGPGQAIRMLRANAALTQAAFGKTAGLDPSQASSMAKGHVDPTWGNMRRPAAALGTSVDGLAEEAERSEER